MTKNDRIANIIGAMAATALLNGECNFHIYCSGSKKNTMSEQGDIISTIAEVDNISININLNEVEESND